jgi:methylenetetrahydrofolate dehydrogenase (NADP+)/methenyltetrahydrofolate cyclohydrolase
MDGVVLGREIRAGVRAEIERGSSAPCLATVVIGDNPRCHILARGKRSAAAEVGMRTVSVDLPATADASDVEQAIAGLGRDPGVDGIFLQLPLPGHLDLGSLLDLVPADKDVDGMRTDSPHGATTALALVRPRERFDVAIAGRRAVVVGRVRGMESLLAARGAHVTQIEDPMPEVCREAEILVAAAGRSGSIRSEHVRPGAAVADVTGDVDPDAISEVAGAIAPYPAAVLPVALACLLRNTLAAHRRGSAKLGG